MTDYLQEMYSSAYYGYVNGDILMHSSIATILSFLSKQAPSDHHLVVGRRYNTYVTSGVKAQLTSQTAVDRFIEEAIEYNEQFIPVAQDYFIFSPGTLTKQNVLPVVIGRNRYDNYLLTVCKQDPSCSLIDGSNASRSIVGS